VTQRPLFKEARWGFEGGGVGRGMRQGHVAPRGGRWGPVTAARGGEKGAWPGH
jgi:hypothetical protein